MANNAYELLALAMRYVFVLIGALMLWRAFRWMRRDARQYQKDMRNLPDAGLVGEMVELATGRAHPLPREGTIGSSRECDIRVKGPGVLRNHAMFAFEEGKGLRVTPRRGAAVLLSGVPVKGWGHALHGTQLQLGETVLRVRLFAGLNVPFAPAYQPEAPDIELDNFYSYEDAEGAPSLPFPAPGFEETEGDGSAASGYEGDYTEDGQMTWQYAYSLEELRDAQAAWEAQAAQTAPDSAEPEEEGGALPYESPLPRRRRRRSRE